MKTKIRGKFFPKPVKEAILAAAMELRHFPQHKDEIIERARKDLEKLGFQPPQRYYQGGDLLFGKILGPDRKNLVETAFQVQKIKMLGKGGVNVVNLIQEVLSGLFMTERIAYDKGYLSFLQDDEKKIFMSACKKLIRLPAHPNLVQFLEYGKKMNGDVAFIFEFAPGKNLKQFILEDQVTMADFLQVAIKGLRAIRHLHRHDMVHCDIKPANFCVLPRRNKLELNLIDLDFTRGFNAYIRDIELKKIPGTVRFVPGEVIFPERIPSKRKDQRKMAFGYDIYAFGVTLYYVLTQSYPPEFQGDEAKVILIRKANKFMKNEPLELPCPSGASREFQEALDIIRDMVQSDWSKRPTVKQLSARFSEIEPTDEALSVRPSEKPIRIEVDQPVDTLGEYVVERRKSKIPYHFPDGTQVYLALLRDRKELRYVGIPNHFKTTKEARSFFKKRSQFLSRLNIIRQKYKDLFPGEYNIVLEFGNTGGTVWTIRPFLDGVITLGRFIEVAPQKLNRETQFNILIRIARSLSALAEAGYRHSNLSLFTIFLVPPFHQLQGKTKVVKESMIIDASVVIDMDTSGDAVSEHVKKDIKQLDLPHTLELMDLNNSQPIEKTSVDPNLVKFIDIMLQMFRTRSGKTLQPEERNMLQYLEEHSKNPSFGWNQVTSYLQNCFKS